MNIIGDGSFFFFDDEQLLLLLNEGAGQQQQGEIAQVVTGRSGGAIGPPADTKSVPLIIIQLEDDYEEEYELFALVESVDDI